MSGKTTVCSRGMSRYLSMKGLLLISSA